MLTGNAFINQVPVLEIWRIMNPLAVFTGLDNCLFLLILYKNLPGALGMSLCSRAVRDFQ